MNRSHPFVRTLLALLAASPLAAHAATINVPADFPTIQGAIDAAADGDTILVAPGTYVGNSRVSMKNLTIRSTGGKDVTILDGNGVGTVFTLVGVQQGPVTGHFGVTLDGFTITNGNGGWGGGVFANYHCDMAILNSLITRNVASAGGGVAADWDAWITLYDTDVTYNSASWAGGGTFGYVGATSVVRGTVAYNTAGSYGGGGAGLYYCGAVRFQDTVVTGNSAAIGGGVFAAFDSACNSSFALSNAIVTKNVASQYGGAAALMNGPAASSYVTGSTITENVAPVGAGWWNDGSTNVGIQDSIIWNNSTPPAFTLNTSYAGVIAYSVLEGDPTSTAGFQGDGTNVFADPQFVDAAAGNYRLKKTSPAIDLGVYDRIAFAPGGTSTDITGMARQGNPDAGAYEYDNVAPTVAVTLSGSLGLNGWYVSPVTADLLAADTGVGVKSLSFQSPAGSATVAGDAASLTFTADGTVALVTSATDKNDNASAPQTTAIAIDRTAPVVTVKASGTAGSSGWYRSPVTVAIAATDATSGVAALAYAVDGVPATPGPGATASVTVGQTAGRTVSASATDLAGNASAVASLTVKVDVTAPTLSISLSTSTIKANGRTTSVRISGTASDALSGVASTVVKVTDRYGKTVATTSLGGSVSLAGTKGQKYTFTATTTDRAGNATVKSASVTVQ